MLKEGTSDVSNGKGGDEFYFEGRMAKGTLTKFDNLEARGRNGDKNHRTFTEGGH